VPQESSVRRSGNGDEVVVVTLELVLATLLNDVGESIEEGLNSIPMRKDLRFQIASLWVNRHRR